MKEETKIYKQIFSVRKGGENGEKYFITLGNMVMSTRLHETEEEAVKELQEINIESIAKMLVAVMSACEEMINNKLKSVKE